MIDHASIPVCDLAVSAKFYDCVLSPLGYTRMVERPATVGFGRSYPELWLNLRRRLRPLPDDWGHHLALRAVSIAAVDAFHATALAAGGVCGGAPGIRHGAQAAYYGAFIRDPDRNRIEVLTFYRPVVA